MSILNIHCYLDAESEKISVCLSKVIRRIKADVRDTHWCWKHFVAVFCTLCSQHWIHIKVVRSCLANVCKSKSYVNAGWWIMWCVTFGWLLNRKHILFNGIHWKAVRMLKLARLCNSSCFGAVHIQKTQLGLTLRWHLNSHWSRWHESMFSTMGILLVGHIEILA